MTNIERLLANLSMTRIGKLNERTSTSLIGIHSDLFTVFAGADDETTVPFIVTEGLRDQARQNALVERGASRARKSRHTTGHALDVAALDENGSVDFNRWSLYLAIAAAFGQAAFDANIPLEWGGCWQRIDLDGITQERLAGMVENYKRDWRKRNPNAASGRGPLIDGPHFQLPTASYPG